MLPSKEKGEQKKGERSSSKEIALGCLMPTILATQELEIMMIEVPGQSRQKVSETPSQSISWV
jgi:hypothetical protein